MTLHEQSFVKGIPLDEDVKDLIEILWERGLQTKSSCQGGGTEPGTEIAFIVFVRIDHAAEFMMRCAQLTNYGLGDNMALTILPPAPHSALPEARVTWLPELTKLITEFYRDVPTPVGGSDS